MASNGPDDFAQTEIFKPEGAPAQAAQNSSPGNVETLNIHFTGSGSEYFRIWIVNLLLTLVTLTLYLPFARARRMAYFQNNTFVGQDPLGFHADSWKMFRGYLVVAAFGIAYWAVTNFLPSFGWIALLVFMALWPLLWRASLQFRLRNTSWRGVRLAFLGDTKGAYSAMLPFFLPALAFVGLLPIDPNDPNVASVDENQLKIMFAAAGVIVVGFVLLMPWFWKRLKTYQHGGYAFTQERADFTATAGQFYKLYFKVGGVGLLVLAGMGTLISAGLVAFAGASMSNLDAAALSSGSWSVMMIIGGVVMALYIVVPLVVGAYAGSRMQNLLWSNTQSQRLRLHSDLRMWPLLRMSLVNWLLIVITLGLFWPFAKVRLSRLKLESMLVEIEGNVDDWVAQASQDPQGALGDAAGDFFGIDMGL
ncbi:hypothetical protein LPB72_04080 [Hydrogenophaga crassostreae]|uniref:DUF898 domain-containing protein n=1 Tax=Hydrogenophaga crassostreae TaxID=1763535 RepID=A0A163CMQ3_9BURK|nr:YjgN family protein [Hydrogenophaga crassostreae]AOW14275.1 hypothetical protein LPB072_16955 [Hydrogenophaga crassostreae]OAD43702.1 hypothetical protein LPB72_04080 [Hydrogenophaga crassostreae]